MSAENPRTTPFSLLMLLVILATLAVCLALVWNSALLHIQLALHLNDLGKFYFDALAFANGATMYGFSPATEIRLSAEVSKQLLNLNPPHMHLILLPFAWLDPPQMLALWLLSGLICVAEVVRRSLRAVGASMSGGGMMFCILGISASAAFGSIIVTGQVTMHLLPLIAWAWLAARRQRWNHTAVALGVAISVKPFLLILIPWLAIRGRFGAAALSLLVTAGCYAIGLAVFGVENHSAWLASLAAIDWHDMPLNASLQGFLVRALRDTLCYEPLFHAPEAVSAMWFVGFLAIGLTSTSLALLDRSPEGVDRAFCILILAALLMSPLGWIYYLLLALPPAIGLFARRRRETESRLPDRALARRLCVGAFGAACVMVLIPTVVVPAGQPSAILTLTLGSVHFWSIFLFWFSTLLDGMRSLSAQGVQLSELAQVARRARIQAE